MSLEGPAQERIQGLIDSNEVVLFMKGNRQMPQCGFSATVIRILDTLIPEYGTVDVLADPEVRENIKRFSDWPTIPQLYVKGGFIGGCDVIQELFGSGELMKIVGVEPGEVTPPSIEIEAEAAKALSQAAEQSAQPGQTLHLTVDARRQSSLSLAPTGSAEIRVELPGLTLYLDPLSAGRANGGKIELVESPQGPSFRFVIPDAPAA